MKSRMVATDPGRKRVILRAVEEFFGLLHENLHRRDSFLGSGMRRLLLLASIPACLLQSLSGADDLKKEDVEKMIASLEKIRAAVMSRNNKQNAVALRAFQKHSASPVAANTFYLECLKKLRFTDEGKRADAWRTYRDNNDSKFNSTYHREAKQLELKYLILTIRAAATKDRRELMQPLIGFIDDLLDTDGRAYEHMDDAKGSLFIEAYDIENSIDPGDWEPDPTDISGIYDEAILPHMREHRDPRLVTAWRAKIDHMRKFADSARDGRLREERDKMREARKESRGIGARRRNDPRSRAEANEEVDPYEEFHAETLPEMKWQMCEDLVKHGFRAEALPLMFGVIREHAEYPEMHTWLNGLEATLLEALRELSGGVLPGDDGATAAAP